MKKNIAEYGFYRVATISPKLFLGKPKENADEIIRLSKLNKDCAVIVFPELSLTGYSCEDLFHYQSLLDETKSAINLILSKTKLLSSMIVFGAPYQTYDGRLYNMAIVAMKGEILGMIPKIHLPNYGEFYEKRWFTSGLNVHINYEDFNQHFLISSNQIFAYNQELILGVEICEDLWAPNPPSVNLALNGANVIANLSASNELVGKSDYRIELIKQQSARLNCAYLYASSGLLESSKDVVFGGHLVICENGSLMMESDKFNLDSTVIKTEIDIGKLSHDRRKNSTFGSSEILHSVEKNKANCFYEINELTRKYSINPFVPSDNNLLTKRASEILNIQASGLCRRILSIGSDSKIVLGLSGGLDSTLALIVAIEACLKLNKPVKDILAISMPGMGTSDRTKNQAVLLAKGFGVSFEEISIVENVKCHFKSIGHDEKLTNVVYENVQARERTMILFNKANQQGGFVLGTGDLSELALGWCTYNGDHMSNYNVNGSIPKTLVKYLVKKYAEKSEPSISNVLDNILATKISPELLPLDLQGNIAQETEDILGPYELHDFFLFHFLRNGFSKEKIEFIALQTFTNLYQEDFIQKCLTKFFARFYQQQFKRTTLPSGPKVGSVSLSPRGDWRMPDELK